MSQKQMDLVWKYSRAKGAALLVAMAIADLADDEGRCSPTNAAIAKGARVDVRTCYRSVTTLQLLHELKIQTSGRGRTRRSSYGMTICHPKSRTVTECQVLTRENMTFDPDSPPHIPPPVLDEEMDPSGSTIHHTASQPSEEEKPIDPKKEIGSHAKLLAEHLYAEHDRFFERPLVASVGRAIGEAKRLVGKYYPREDYDPEELRALATEWMAHWNDEHEFNRDDFGMTAFVEKHVVIASWSERRAEKKRHRR